MFGEVGVVVCYWWEVLFDDLFDVFEFCCLCEVSKVVGDGLFVESYFVVVGDDVLCVFVVDFGDGDVF